MNKNNKQTNNKKTCYATADIKDWANCILADKLFKPVLSELESVYSPEDALKIYVIAILRTCFKGSEDNELKEQYDNSFISELYPGIAVSKNTVSSFLYDLGKACSRIFVFMHNRVKQVKAGSCLLITGALKTDESQKNSLPDFGKKAAKQKTEYEDGRYEDEDEDENKDIAVIYAFDVTAKEPVCAASYPGLPPELTLYEDFIAKNSITQGIIIDDKGSPASGAREYFKGNPDTHVIKLLKRNPKIAQTLDLYKYEKNLPNNPLILYKKAYDKKSKKNGCSLIRI